MRKKKLPKIAKPTRNSFVNEVTGVFRTNPFSAMNYRQVSRALGIEDPASRQLVKNIMEQLSKEKILFETKTGRYKLNPGGVKDNIPGRYIEGLVDMKQTGKAYIISDETAEDVYVAQNNTHHALHGDKVKVLLLPRRKGRKLEGQIVEIIVRARENFVGKVQLYRNFALLEPDSQSMNITIYIPLSRLNGAKNGQKAIAKITEWPEKADNPFGEIIEVLGNPGDNDVEMHSILASFDFPISFPKAAEAEAEKIHLTLSSREISNRRDYREVFTCTVDPEDANDFDDALSLKKLSNGNWEVGVHIADVSHYVKPQSAIDKEAYNRGTSVYMVDRVVPMLPEKLSNFVCSLRPHEEKLCYAAVFEMTPAAVILQKWFGKTVICSDYRYHYDQVQKVIEGGEDPYKTEIMTLHQLATILREERFKNGSIAFRSQDIRFNLDATGKPLGVMIKESKEANWLIEEFMLLANRSVAEFIGKNKGKTVPKTFVYRVHDQPPAEKLNVFVEFVSKLGYKMKLNSRRNMAGSFNKLFIDIAGKGEENLIETIAIRTMAKAVYSTKNIGHYGLAFDHYTHFTSPIRRYPDLMVHRLLERYMEGKPGVDQAEYEKKCEHASDMEKKAVDAERASVKYKQVEFLKDKTGVVFDGLISGVSKWGVFVQVIENKCEGLVPFSAMADDFYYLDEENYRVVGQRNGKAYQLGDPVKIKVIKADLSKKQIDFEFAGEPDPDSYSGR